MTNTLSRLQAIILGFVVVAAVALGAAGLVAVAAKQGFGRETFTVSVGFPEAHDVAAGTPVRVRGVEAGQVVAVDYPDGDGPIMVRMQLDAQFRDKLHADAKAQIQPTGLLGSKVIAVQPGTTAAGPLTTGTLSAAPTPDIASLAAEGEAALKDIRGMVGDVRTLAGDVRGTVKRVDGVVESEAANVRGLMQDSRDAIVSVRQNSEAVSRLPIVRGYVENVNTILVRPDCRREVMAYNANDLFEPGTAILTDTGRHHLGAVVEWLRGQTNTKAEAVVAAANDPGDPAQSHATAEQLTRKQAEVVAEYLKLTGAHKMGWWSRRKVTAIGLGKTGSPVVEKEKLPANFVQVLLFTPQ
ncbi:MlaD family protein [Limnoglobus roseus]|uniref:MCE family protein n=1 Tax=Limnoglobus roseus TaxID=2598579 RepID=A0A5C1A969_9BACT|nr:MCE family protein [Limnoglobus roseus]QEL14352.1 MCE family protein [Limnoglobus roseus]